VAATPSRRQLRGRSRALYDIRHLRRSLRPHDASRQETEQLGHCAMATRRGRFGAALRRYVWLPAPLVAGAWGPRLLVHLVDDVRLADFVDKFADPETRSQ
jgi:hypothetical protein